MPVFTIFLKLLPNSFRSLTSRGFFYYSDQLDYFIIFDFDFLFFDMILKLCAILRDNLANRRA